MEKYWFFIPTTAIDFLLVCCRRESEFLTTCDFEDFYHCIKLARCVRYIRPLMNNLEIIIMINLLNLKSYEYKKVKFTVNLKI